MSDLTIQPASQAEFQIAIDWAAAEGWNPGLDDLPAFHGANPDGFLLGTIGETPVAAISVVRYGADFGFLGFYIVHPDHRGQGTGIAIWDAGMAHLEGRTVGLDGVVDQQDNYRKSGFALAGRNVRYAGVPKRESAQGAIRAATASDLAAIQTYDRPLFAGDRGPFIQAWTLPPSQTRRVCFISEHDGELTGYGVIRACRDGYKIGPLFADNEQIAEGLFSALCQTTDEASQIILDVPESNAAAVRLAERHGLKNVFETARMYRGSAPDLPIERTFGITSFELG